MILVETMRARLYSATKHISEVIAGVSACPSKSEVMEWATNFEALLQNRYGRLLFRKFLQKEYCEECIEFYQEVEKFKKLHFKKMPMQAKKIYEKYMKPGSIREVNLDQDIRNNVKNSIEVGKVTRETLYEAQKSIRELMERDSYQRFLKSEAYLKCLEKDQKYGSTETLTPSMKSRSSITLITI